MAMGDEVLVQSKWPKDYHCSCEFCKVRIGELRPADGSYYSRLERNQYYAKEERGEGGHIAKTPLHIARWAVQQYTKRGDWVLDPTAGAGTTAVEAMTQGRNFAGMELQYGDVIQTNISKHARPGEGIGAMLRIGDAREIGSFLREKLGRRRVALVVNNPPYWGDQSMPARAKSGLREDEVKFLYDKTLPNLAFLKEGQEYWDTISSIYGECVRYLRPGGHFVIGVKDQSRNKAPDGLHRGYCGILGQHGLKFVGTSVLRHYPGTMHLNSCFKRHGFHPPYYQTINVFRKS